MGNKECQGDYHRYKVTMCNGINCNGRNNAKKRKICINNLCGFDSKENEGALLCRLCYIAEKMRTGEKDAEEEYKMRPKLTKVSGVSYDSSSNEFIY